MSVFMRYIKDESGATAIEYGLLGALIGVGLLAGLKTLGGGSGSMWGDMSNNVTGKL